MCRRRHVHRLLFFFRRGSRRLRVFERESFRRGVFDPLVPFSRGENLRGYAALEGCEFDGGEPRGGVRVLHLRFRLLQRLANVAPGILVDASNLLARAFVRDGERLLRRSRLFLRRSRLFARVARVSSRRLERVRVRRRVRRFGATFGVRAYLRGARREDRLRRAPRRVFEIGAGEGPKRRELAFRLPTRLTEPIAKRARLERGGLARASQRRGMRRVRRGEAFLRRGEAFLRRGEVRSRRLRVGGGREYVAIGGVGATRRRRRRFRDTLEVFLQLMHARTRVGGVAARGGERFGECFVDVRGGGSRAIGRGAARVQLAA